MLQASYIIMARGIMQMQQEIERSEHGPRGSSRRAVSLKVFMNECVKLRRFVSRAWKGEGVEPSCVGYERG